MSSFAFSSDIAPPSSAHTVQWKLHATTEANMCSNQDAKDVEGTRARGLWASCGMRAPACASALVAIPEQVVLLVKLLDP